MPDVNCKCGNVFNVADDMAGKVVPCPQCGANVYVRRVPKPAFGDQFPPQLSPGGPSATAAPAPPPPRQAPGAASRPPSEPLPQRPFSQAPAMPPAPPPAFGPDNTNHGDAASDRYRLPPSNRSYQPAAGIAGSPNYQYALYVVLALVFYFVTGQFGGGGFGKKLQYGSMEIYYASGVTETEARAFGTYMRSNGWGKKPCSIQLKRQKQTYEVRLVIDESYISDDEFVKSAEMLGRLVSSEVFGGSRVDVHLCDGALKTLRVVSGGVPLGKPVSFSKIKIYRAPGVTDAEVDRLGKYLLKLGLGDIDALIQLVKRTDCYQFRVVVSESALKNPKSKKLHEEIAAELSKDVFGRKKVEVHMCDEFFNTIIVVDSLAKK